MIVCCYTKTDKQWSDDELQHKLSLLPSPLREQALRKRQWPDRQLTISGKLLLLEVLRHFELDKTLCLADMQYNTYHRPFLKGAFDFNIAHSGNIAICCGVLNGKTGIDIEQIKDIDLSIYTDYFTPNEWEQINSSDIKTDAFYTFWTRKEAVLKAIGTGFHTPLSTIDVSGDVVVYDSLTYYLQELEIQDGYKCCMAANVPDKLKLAVHL